MKSRSNDNKWFHTHRQEWISEAYRVFGFANKDIIRLKFGISAQLALHDLYDFHHANEGVARNEFPPQEFVRKNEHSAADLSIDRSSEALRSALRTHEAAVYLGCSSELLKKWRAKKPKDPGEHGPPWLAVTSRLILYRIADLDAWLKTRSNDAAEKKP